MFFTLVSIKVESKILFGGIMSNGGLKNNIRIAYFAGSMKPGQDGVTRVLYRLVDNLNNNEIKHIFFTSIAPSTHECSSTIIKVPSVKFPLYKDYRFAVPGIKHFENYLNSFSPDIIHINSPCSLGCAAIKYGRKYNIPVVATYHTHFPSYAKYYKINTLEMFGWNYLRSLYNKCERVYVPSIPVMDELKKHQFKTVTFLPHGVDTEMFNPIYNSKEWKKKLGIEGKQALLFAGRLVWEKDLKVLAETYKIINSQRNDAVFVLAGDGPIRKELEQLMPEAVFLGYQSGADLSTAYASSDIFVFPSTTETFGNVTVEAMASGLPPVCAKEGGAYGIIQAGVTGLLAEPRNPKDLADKLIYLLDNPGIRMEMARKAVEFANEQTWENIFRKLYHSYAEVIYNYQPKRNHRKRKAA